MNNSSEKEGVFSISIVLLVYFTDYTQPALPVARTCPGCGDHWPALV